MKAIARARILEAVTRNAGMLALDYYRRRDSLTVEHKGRQDLVSEADRTVEQFIRTQIAEIFPDDGFFGEELPPSEPRDAAGTWVIDPIDGTWCFVNGIGSWCVSIAYVERGQTTLGAIFDPNANELFSAVLDHGAFLNGRPIRVADAKAFTDGTISVGFAARQPAEAMFSTLEHIVRHGGLYHRHGSGALALAWTAAGRLIGYVESHMNSWDCLAGLLLVEQAGGWAAEFMTGAGLQCGNRVIAGPKRMRPLLEAATSHWDDIKR